LSDAGVAALKGRAARYSFPDPELRGHYVRVQPSGAKSFVAVTRDSSSGKQVWTTIGPADLLTIEEAREKAREVIKRVLAGRPAFAPPVKAETFGEVADNWLQRHVVARGLRSEKEIRRILSVYVSPHWKDRPFRDIRRVDIASLLDRIEDANGARQSDYVLAVIRQISVWHGSRDDDYVVPFTRGMRRGAAPARARILDDLELRAVWKAAEASGAFGALVRLALLTAQRREKLLTLKWTDISPDGVWTIASGPREKGTAGELKLPSAAIEVIEALPRFAGNPFVFAASRGGGPLSGFSKMKKALDAKIAAERQKLAKPAERGAPLPDMARWVLHDLRRTARSLMSRAGVPGEHGERVLGHAQPGVQGVYDRHAYFDEKAAALRRLAALIDGIVHPRPEADTVVPMRERKTR
jgi:integrase